MTTTEITSSLFISNLSWNWKLIKLLRNLRAKSTAITWQINDANELNWGEKISLLFKCCIICSLFSISVLYGSPWLIEWGCNAKSCLIGFSTVHSLFCLAFNWHWNLKVGWFFFRHTSWTNSLLYLEMAASSTFLEKKKIEFHKKIDLIPLKQTKLMQCSVTNEVDGD